MAWLTRNATATKEQELRDSSSRMSIELRRRNAINEYRDGLWGKPTIAKAAGIIEYSFFCLSRGRYTVDTVSDIDRAMDPVNSTVRSSGRKLGFSASTPSGASPAVQVLYQSQNRRYRRSNVGRCISGISGWTLSTKSS
jgi:hypothetical protein